MGPRSISLVIPTLNEIQSLPVLIKEVDSVIVRNPAVRIEELVLVDDGSTDGTAEYISHLQDVSRLYSVQLVSRTVKHGPAHAELEGILRAGSDLVIKMDADGQHAASFLPTLCTAFASDTDIVVASRYVYNGGTSWPPSRGIISRVARFLARALIPGARRLQDPISGYFMLRKNLVRSLSREPPRYKLLLYILALNPNLRVKEVPFVMGRRQGGQSKVVGRSMSYVTSFLIELLTYWRCSLNVGSLAYTKARNTTGGASPDPELSPNAPTNE